MSSSARIPHPIVACLIVYLERTLAFVAIFRCHNFTKECPADSRRLTARFLPDARRFRTIPLILARIPARTGNRRRPGVRIVREWKYLRRKRCEIVTTLWNEWREVTSAKSESLRRTLCQYRSKKPLFAFDVRFQVFAYQLAIYFQGWAGIHDKSFCAWKTLKML